MHVMAIKPETILYFYMAVCIAVLLFNILYIFWDRYKGRKFEERSLGLVDDIRRQIETVKHSGKLEMEEIEQLKRSMRRPERLRAFEHSMEEAETQLPAEDCRKYLESLRAVFLDLAGYYSRRDSIEQAYFASIVKMFGIDQGYPHYDGLMDALVAMVIGPDVYDRENALGALYSIGSEDAILAAWQKMQANGVRHSVKLLADGLLTFSGDKAALAHKLFERRTEFDAELVLPIMQFIRFSSDAFREEFLELMKREEEDKELRLEAVRYFRKYPYAPAKEVLFKFLRYQEYIDWEYAAMAALALAEYPGTDTEDCLKEGLHASNWFIRLNCAQSLIYGLGISQMRLYDIYNGRDRYAREILRYVSEQQAIKAQQMGAEEFHV